MTPQERIDFIVRECSGDSLATFSRDTGINYTVASRLRKGKLGVSASEGLGPYAERIFRAYRQLSAEWLLTGEGEPLKGDERKTNIDNIMARLRRLEQAVFTTKY